jgi:phage shock protein C
MDTPNTTQPSPLPPIRPRHQGITGGLVLIAIGVLFLLNNLLPDFHFGDYWPLILIAVGAGLLWNSRKSA